MCLLNIKKCKSCQSCKKYMSLATMALGMEPGLKVRGVKNINKNFFF